MQFLVYRTVSLIVHDIRAYIVGGFCTFFTVLIDVVFSRTLNEVPKVHVFSMVCRLTLLPFFRSHVDFLSRTAEHHLAEVGVGVRRDLAPFVDHLQRVMWKCLGLLGKWPG